MKLTSIALSAAITLLPLTANAATRSLWLEFLGPVYGGSIVTGSLEFDENQLDADGNGYLTPTTGFTSLEFVFEGQVFSLSDGYGYPDWPSMAVTDFLITDLDMIINGEPSSGPNHTPIDAPHVSTLAIHRIADDGNTLFGTIGSLEYGLAPVPLPAGLPLFLGGLGLMGLTKRLGKRS